MINKVIKIFTIILISLTILTGCSILEETDAITTETPFEEVGRIKNGDIIIYYYKDTITDIMYIGKKQLSGNGTVAGLSPLYKNTTEVYTYEDWLDNYWPKVMEE